MSCWNLSEAEEAFANELVEASFAPKEQKEQIIKGALQHLAQIAETDTAKQEAVTMIQELLQDPDFGDFRVYLRNYQDFFNKDFDVNLVESRQRERGQSKIDGEDADPEAEIRLKRASKKFIRDKFTDGSGTAARAALYFKRDTKLKLMSIFMVNRDKGYLVSTEEIPESVRQFKQELVDTIVTYLKTQGYTDNSLGNTQLFENGIYHNILSADSPLKSAINDKLKLGGSIDTEFIKDSYDKFRTKKDGWETSKKFIEAFNAVTLLNNFDSITTMLVGNIVRPVKLDDKISNTKYEVKINRATNMWSNGLGDDVKDIADLISDVSQMLVQTSKKYSWKGEAMEDQYLTFSDFNYIITKIKKFASNPQALELKLNDEFFEQEGNQTPISNTTQNTIDTIKQLKIEQGYTNPDVTFSDVLSFISDNPQRHLHSIFDLLCKTNIVDHFTSINTNDKNLIWSLGKELFGTWGESSRSLYDLHKNSNNDRIFEIITQIADSMFQEQFLQYYEDAEGTLKIRILQDYSLAKAKNELLHSMKQTHSQLNEEAFQQYLQKHQVTIDYRSSLVYEPGKFHNSWSVGNINIWHGSGENAELSNFAKRPFIHIWRDGFTNTFQSVEQAFQYAKAKFAKDSEVAEEILKETKGPLLRKLGKQVKGLNTTEWDKYKDSFIYNFIKESFEQNPSALELLRATGDKLLTHNQDKGEWGKKFPQLLMKVRKELTGNAIPEQATPTAVTAKFINKIQIPIGNWLTLTYNQNGFEKLSPKNTHVKSAEELEAVWKSNEFRSFIKDTIGIDFNTDVELTSAYEEVFKDPANPSKVSYKALIEDIANLCTSALYNQAFNNIVVPSTLRSGNRERNKRNIETLRALQYVNQTPPRINSETGAVEMLNDSIKDAYLDKLAQATGSVNGIFSSSQVKTAENTAVAAQSLSNLRSSYPYQIVTQNKAKNSATKNITFVQNDNGFFKGVVSRREFKSDATVKVNTAMSSVESYHASFLGFLGAFINSTDSTTINRNGIAFIVPAVYSDKTKMDELMVDLHAISKHQNKRFQDMTDEELESELKYEFGGMYDSVINNVNEENLKLANLLGISASFNQNPVLAYREILREISDKLCDNSTLLNLAENTKDGESPSELATFCKTLEAEGKTASDIMDAIYNGSNPKFKDFKKTLGKLRKKRISSEMYSVLTEYNKTHRTIPIETSEQIHYLYDSDGYLVPNNTLIALWGRFNGNLDINRRLGITKLYNKDKEHASTLKGYFKYEKDFRTVEELLNDGFEFYLQGALAKAKQPEVAYLLKEYPDWVTKSGKMALAKVFIPDTRYALDDEFFQTDTAQIHRITKVDGTGVNAIYTVETTNLNDSVETHILSQSQLDALKNKSQYDPISPESREGHWEICDDINTFRNYKNSPYLDYIQVHPMLSKLNRLSYLAAQQYTSCVGGAHYVYKGGGADVLEEEASRWLASNKRNVCYASTVHKYQNKTLNGVPKYYNIAPIEDIKSTVYSIMGDYDEHKPIDGGMFVNPWFYILENNSLGGEAAGMDKKQFGTYYYERYAAGGIIKTAGFALTNQRMRRSDAYRALGKNMTNRSWIKEFADTNGVDIEEKLDITRDYKGNVLNWIQDRNGQYTYYSRDIDDQGHVGRFRLAKIEAIYTNDYGEEQIFTGNVPEGWTPTNKYKLYEFPVTSSGEIDLSHPEIAKQLNEDPTKPLKPIQRTDDTEDGICTINSNWDLYTKVFGGFNSMAMNSRGKLQYSENSIFQMVEALNNIGYPRDKQHNDYRFGNTQYIKDRISEVLDQDDLWQPLKYSDISYAPNIGALKSTQMNVNPSKAMHSPMFLNAMRIRMAQLGIQLDKEHHADASEVSMPTQIIQACANKGYTIAYSSQLYKSLSTLTEIAIEDCMDGIMELMPGETNKGTLLTEVAQIIVNKLIHTQDDNVALEAALSHLIEKSKAGEKLTPDDVIGKVAWSDSGLYNKIYSDLATHLTNEAIKMKFPGTLAVICPTEKVEQMYGNKRFDAYEDLDKQISIELGLQNEQNAIRLGQRPDQLIFDWNSNGNADVKTKLSLASKLDTQHHYWIEWVGDDGKLLTDTHGIPFRESITLDTPDKYIQLKNWLAYDGKEGFMGIDGTKVSRKGKKIARIYENIMDGRELGAYNVRFNGIDEDGQSLRYNIFDLSSVQQLFNYNKIPKTWRNAVQLLNDTKFIQDRGKAMETIAKVLNKKSPEAFTYLTEKAKEGESLITALRNAPEPIKDITVSTIFDVCKVLTHKAMEKDLFKISKDYEGDRKVYINGDLIEIDPTSIETQAYELIMPKIYQMKYGLRENDQVSEILSDPDFFTKRALERVKDQKVDPQYFHYELKNFNGNHIYIWDSKLGQPDSNIFKSKTFYPQEVETGKYERWDIDGNYMHGLSSEDDKIMTIGDQGYEVIVTDNPEYYLENMQYNLGTFSNKTIHEEELTNLVANLKDTKNRKAKKFVNALTDHQGNLKKFNSLIRRNNAVNSLNLESEANEDPEVSKLRRAFIKEGYELWASFDQSLNIIAGRIPAQSQQSFMPQRVVAFDNNDINSAYVSTFQLFLQGSRQNLI